jgi:hypothetical protein
MSATGTRFQSPRGENRGPQRRAAALVDQAEPGDSLTHLDLDEFLGVHLPGQVRRGGPRGVGPGPLPRRGGHEAGAAEAALERSGRRDPGGRRVFQELGADQLGAPGGVLAAEPDGGLRGVRDGSVARRAIVGSDAVAASIAEPPEQSPDGDGGEVELSGDLRGVAALLPEPE